MGKIGQWLGNKFFKIGDTVEREVNKRLEKIYKVNILGTEIQKNTLFNYRQQEYKSWSLDSANKLLEFYNTQLNPSPYNTERLLFWSWVKDVNVPKLHYSAPQRVINQMKSLLFSSELDIHVLCKNKEKSKEQDSKLHKILADINLYELLQQSVNYETYSGTLSWKPTMDTDLSDSPIVECYPAEQIMFRAKRKKAQEIIYIDEYKKEKDKIFYLKSIYGKGYIKYELWDKDFKKLYPLNTIEELKGLKNIAIVDKNNKPIKILLSTYKKNREVNSEFPDSLYGGSDFQGVTDSFHLIDELYSQKMLVTRRSRPITRMSEALVPYDPNTGKSILPKEYENDLLLTKKDSDLQEKGMIDRDVPTLAVAEYDKAIEEEMKNIFATIGMAYTTVGLETHSANISGIALETKEKMTVIIRNNKIRLWKAFLKESLRLLMIFNDLKTAKFVDDGQTITYMIEDEYDYTYQVEFPNYHDQSLDEKVDSVSKMMDAGLMDRKTAFDRVFGSEYTEEERDQIILNAKMENNIPLLENDVNKDE